MKKNFSFGFFVSNVISKIVFSHFDLLHLALGPNW